MATNTKRQVSKAERDLCGEMGARILHARLAAGFRSAAALAEKIGVRYQQVLKYENGINWPNPYMLTLIAQATKKPVAHFLEGDRPVHPLPSAAISIVQTLKTLKAGDKLVRAASDFIGVPLVEGHLAGGTPREVEEHIIGWVLVHREHLRGREHRDLQAVRLEGRSMQPILNDHAVLVVDVRDKTLAPKGIYAIRTADGCTAKYATQRGNQLVIWQHNTEENKDFPRCLDLRIEENPIVGRVVWCWQPLI